MTGNGCRDGLRLHRAPAQAPVGRMESSSALLSPHVWRSLRLEWLWVYDGFTPRAREWSGRVRVPPGVFFVKAGQVRIEAEGKEIRLRPGDAFFSAPGERRQWFEEGTRLLSAGLKCEWPDGRPVFVEGLNIRASEKRTDKLRTATERLFASIHGPRRQVTYPEAVLAPESQSLSGWALHEAAFRAWFQVYVQTLETLGIQPTARQGTTDHRLENLRSWLLNWPLDRPPDLQQAATAHALGARRVRQLLQQDLGQTPQAFWEKRRMEEAMLRLLRETTPLKEIAFALGFRHPPQFTVWFRRHTGLSPSAYREGRRPEGA